ncbi:hypothetical protein DSM3645_10342 [Blastopirellula marina DSM 3645]|uniref:Core-binding (CB) domain-containing protein n=1 Tax=Blastopirellula marina DSM 3645 TaxID=314230 RepID=A3ZM09_9BACT|nr:hypothetical protein DSM3645_10342 [Blastopirellula marina DSM 3645]
MPKSTPKKIASIQKPRKPHPDFPLWAHPSGQWCKKVNGKFHYFGTWIDPQAALDRWLDQKDDILAGREVRQGAGLKVRDLVNAFLNSKTRLVESEELAKRTWESYDRRMGTVLESLGKGRHVETLRPIDFEKLRAIFAKDHGPVTLTGDITIVRSLFKYAYESDLIAKPIKFGPNFKPPSRATLRKNRQERGKKLFDAPQIRAMIAGAGSQLRAMIYLGINCGFGNNDCCKLPLAAVQLDKGWLEFGRPKTGIERRCPLWPETVEALRAVLAKRPEHETDRVFITKYGNTWEPKSTTDNPISNEASKLLKTLKIHRKGLGFYPQATKGIEGTR